jgi:hypothetical protein
VWKRLNGNFFEYFEGFSEHGIFHGICRVLQSEKQRCHKLRIGSVGFVIEHVLKCKCVPDVPGDNGFTLAIKSLPWR